MNRIPVGDVGVVKRLWWKWIAKPTFNLRYAIAHSDDLMRLAQERETYRQEAMQLFRQIEQLDLGGVSYDYPSGLPHWSVGYASRFSRMFGITLDIGTSYSECRAILPKDKWANPISPDANVWSYSLFCKQDPETVNAIQAISRWPDIAIAKCAVNAKKAGVI